MKPVLRSRHVRFLVLYDKRRAAKLSHSNARATYSRQGAEYLIKMPHKQAAN